MNESRGEPFVRSARTVGGGRRPIGIAVLFLLAGTILLAGCSAASSKPVIPSLPPPTEPTSTTQAPPETTIPEPEPEPEGIRLTVGDDFQAAVDAAPEGTAFVIESGIHRAQEVVPKNGMTFVGLPGAVMAGAIVLDTWTLDDSKRWRFDGISASIRSGGTCNDGYDGCKLSQDLFMDDVMLQQVTDKADLGPGRWYWQGETVFVGDDPGKRRVELSVASHAFSGEASDVTIRGIVVEKYAAPAQTGAIQASAPGNDVPLADGWLIEDSEVRLNHGAGIRLGDRTTVRGVFIHDNGQLGVVANGGTGSIIEDSEIAGNNIAGFKWGWEAGGSKFKRTVGLIVRRTIVRDNNGPGLWTDIDNYDTLYEFNTVTDNYASGIFHEISYNAVIRNNTVTGNGFGNQRWLWGAGILVAASSDVEVYGNTVTDNADGIAGIQQDRGKGAEGPRLLSNLFVHDNTIAVDGGQIGIVEDVGSPAVFEERNNRFESNTYVDVKGQRYMWLGKELNAAGWQREGQDLEGTWR